MSTLDINTLAKLVTDAQTHKDSTNDTFIKPPVLYGSEPLTPTDIDTLRLYRKDTRGFASLEGTLQYINQFLQDKEQIVNEHELVKALCIILPTDCLETLEHLRFKNAGIEETYRTVLWKRLNTETSQRGNASKTGFEEFPFFFGKSLKTGKC